MPAPRSQASRESRPRSVGIVGPGSPTRGTAWKQPGRPRARRLLARATSRNSARPRPIAGGRFPSWKKATWLPPWALMHWLNSADAVPCRGRLPSVTCCGRWMDELWFGKSSLPEAPEEPSASPGPMTCKFFDTWSKRPALLGPPPASNSSTRRRRQRGKRRTRRLRRPLQRGDENVSYRIRPTTGWKASCLNRVSHQPISS